MKRFKVIIGFISPPRGLAPVTVGTFEAVSAQFALLAARDKIAELDAQGTPQAQAL